MDQVQNLTSLMASEKQASESGAEESAKQNAKFHQLVEQLQANNEKTATLESTVASLRAQNDAHIQAYARIDSDLARARADAERNDAELTRARSDVARMEGELARARTDVERMEGELARARTDAESFRNNHAGAKGETELLNQTILYLTLVLFINNTSLFGIED